ncbi:hypothetical protein ZHAS_00018943 [Anopheles sinensis]|uniref:Uncharacterized protein n=1 Tax=Anopheles sinensis TaxID=74873 RepID=A0A084WK76_ANOSI|nr:hypothetical protein ZHAS_00018943 [Anopheles sinensis]
MALVCHRKHLSVNQTQADQLRQPDEPSRFRGTVFYLWNRRQENKLSELSDTSHGSLFVAFTRAARQSSRSFGEVMMTRASTVLREVD